MLLVPVLILGGVAYAGVKTWMTWVRQQKMVELTLADDPASGSSSAARDELQSLPDESQIAHYYTVTFVALVFATIGSIFYYPLALLSVPLTLYSTLPIFERVWSGLFLEGGKNNGIIRSVFIIATLATRYYATAAFVASFHYFIKLLNYRASHFMELVAGLEQDYRQFMAQFSGEKPKTVWVVAHGMGIEIPFDQLRVGDVVMIKAREVVPVDGTVTEGTAQVSLFMATGEARQLEVKTGDRLLSSTIVLAGNLCLRVDRL